MNSQMAYRSSALRPMSPVAQASQARSPHAGGHVAHLKAVGAWPPLSGLLHRPGYHRCTDAWAGRSEQVRGVAGGRKKTNNRAIWYLGKRTGALGCTARLQAGAACHSSQLTGRMAGSMGRTTGPLHRQGGSAPGGRGGHRSSRHRHGAGSVVSGAQLQRLAPAVGDMRADRYVDSG